MQGLVALGWNSWPMKVWSSRQSPPSMTTTVRSRNSCRPGLPYFAMPSKMGMKSSAESRQPVSMIHLRPMRSESQPKNTKKGVARMSAMVR